MKQRLPLLILGIVIGALVVYVIIVTRTTPAQQTSDKPKIVTSFYPLYFFTKEIAGDNLDVFNLTPVGAEPHEYEPSAKDLARIYDSMLLIVNGDLEPWIKDIEDGLRQKNIPVITATEGKTNKDPHLWLNPKLALAITLRIADAFIRIDGEHEREYRANVERLQEKLQALDMAYRNNLRQCAQRTFITSHVAFGYLAKEYGLTQMAIAGLSPDAEPSAKDLAEVAQFARKEKIKYIFFETIASPKLSETIAKEIGARTLVLNPIEGLTPEEMANGKNYFTAMNENLTNLKLALSCQ